VAESVMASGAVSAQLKKWEADGKEYAKNNGGNREIYDQELLQRAEDMLGGTSTIFNGEKIEFPGSNYYKTFKDTDVFKNFTNADRLRLYAEYKLLEEKKGSAYAMNVIESEMEKYVNENQSEKDWAKNTIRGVWNGGVANIANKLMGYEGIAIKSIYGDKGLGWWLDGRNPETGEPMTNMFTNIFFNPDYWRKVEDYNTFDPDEHAKIDANGGISPYQNVYGTHSPEIFSWQTANEAIKMMKFAWSDYLVGRVLGGGTKWATGKAGGMFARTGEFLAKESPMAARAIHGLGVTFTLGTSATGMSEAYGKMTFDQIQREGYADIMKKIDADVQQMVEIQMHTDNIKAAIQKYVNDKTI
jgi:hypothetical protein